MINTDSDTSLLENIANLILTLIFVPLSLMWHGYVAVKLWAWFVIPTFTNAPVLTIATAIGLMALIRLFTYAVNYNAENPDTELSPVEKVFRDAFMGFSVPLTALIIGWFCT